MRKSRRLLFVGFEWTGQLILDDFAGLSLDDADSRKRHPTTFTDMIHITTSKCLPYIPIWSPLFRSSILRLLDFGGTKVTGLPPTSQQISLLWGLGFEEYQKRYIYS